MASGAAPRSGDALGGTALSNPMKSFFGIEHMRLKGKRVTAAISSKARCPTSPISASDHYFGAIFEVDDGGRNVPDVMAIVPCAARE